VKLVRQVAKFAWATARWLWAGSPKRGPCEVQDIFYTHCAPCGHYHPRLGECTRCECSVSPNSDERNKIVWKTETCPEELW